MAQPPSSRLTVVEYRQLKESGATGLVELDNIFENVIADLIDRDQVVEPEWRGQLLNWLHTCIPAFLERRLLQTLTTKQIRALKVQIGKDGEHVISRLSTLYAMDLIPPNVENANAGIFRARDIRLLQRILARAEQYQLPERRAGTNASNPALRHLAFDICALWTGLIGQGAWTGRPLIEKGSPFFEFAKYIFAYVGQPCDVRMVAERLRQPLLRVLEADIFSAGPRRVALRFKYSKRGRKSVHWSYWAQSLRKYLGPPTSSIFYIKV